MIDAQLLELHSPHLFLSERYRLLRLRAKVFSQDLSSLHNSLHSIFTRSLYRLGQVIPLTVREYLTRFSVAKIRSKLFGIDDEDIESAELDKALSSGEDANEIQKLREEAAAFVTLRKDLASATGRQAALKKVIRIFSAYVVLSLNHMSDIS